MRRAHVQEWCTQYRCLLKKLSPKRVQSAQTDRQFSNGCHVNRQKISSTLDQQVLRENIIAGGIVRSAYPDIEPIKADFTVDKFIWENLDSWPDHVAIECGITGQKYTYSQLRILCTKFATSLRKQGFQPGQVVSIMLPNLPDYVIALMGIIEAGLIASLINPIYTSYEISHQLHDSGAVACITLPQLLCKLDEAKKQIRTTHNVAVKLQTIVVNYDATISVPSDVIDFKEMISTQTDYAGTIITHNRTVEDVAILPYSSGTTGLSKGVQLSHRNCISNCYQIMTPETNHFYQTTSNYQDVLPAVLPFFHIYGVVIILMRALRHGVKMVTLPKFEALPFFSILKNHRANFIYAVPPIVLLLGNHPHLTDDHLATMRVVMSGGAPLGTEDVERVKNRFKSNLVFVQGYGATETSSAVFVGSELDGDYTTVGKPIRSTLTKIIKLDGSIAKPMELGEIWVKGPQVMMGYHNRPDATKEVIDEEKYFHTGDIGYYDEYGKLYVVDRLKELIKVKGFQVPPAELEALLRSHSEVTDAAVIGIPDEKTGEKPLAFVVTKVKSKIQSHELIDFVSSKVAPYKKLSNVKFVDSIPRTAAGKILRRKLKEIIDSKN